MDSDIAELSRGGGERRMTVVSIYLLIGVVTAFLIAKYLKPDVSDPKFSALESPQVQRAFLAVIVLVWPVLLLGLRLKITRKKGGE